MGLPYDVCVDANNGIHNFTRNAYEQMYPGVFYTTEVQVCCSTEIPYASVLRLSKDSILA